MPGVDNIKSDKKPLFKKRWFIISLIIVLVIIVWFVGSVMLAFHNLKTGKVSIEDYMNGDQITKLNNPTPSDQVDLANTNLYTSDDPYLGNLNAAFRIVEFSDFQCPYCGQEAPIMRALAAKYPDKILFIYRDFPIDDVHPDARLAAEAGVCAQEQGKFWQYYDILFANQDNLKTADLLGYASQAGMDVNIFGDCLSSGRNASEVEDDFQAGLSAGVDGTPTFFVNGQKVEGVILLENWEQAINSF